MSKKSTTPSNLYFALNVISRGRPNERQPGDLFEAADDEAAFLLEHEAIRPAEDAEIALWEKTRPADPVAEKAPAKKPADAGKPVAEKAPAEKPADAGKAPAAEQLA